MKILFNRVNIVLTVIIIFFIIITVKLYSIQVFHHLEYQKLANFQNLDSLKNIPLRGKIFDKNGLLLAFDKNVADVYINFEKVPYESEFSSYLSKHFSINLDSLISHQNDRNWKRILVDYPINSTSRFNPFYNSVVHFEFKKKRIYPWGKNTSSIIGFVGKENFGLEGIEYLYNEKLSPDENIILRGKDVHGNTKYFENPEEILSNGDDIHLNIDILLSEFLQNSYDEIVRKDTTINAFFSALIDVESEELISTHSYPSFNPNNFASLNRKNLFNRLCRQVFFPSAAFDILYLIMKHNTCDLKISFDSIQNCENYKIISTEKTLRSFRETFTELKLKNKDLQKLKIGERISIDFASQDIGYKYWGIEKSKNNNLNIGDYIICNPLQFLFLYTNAFFSSPVIPKVVFQQNQNTNIHKKPFLNENVLFALTQQSYLGTKELMENLTFTDKSLQSLTLLMGYFKINNNYYILMLGEIRDKKKSASCENWLLLKNNVQMFYKNKFPVLSLLVKKNKDFVNSMKENLKKVKYNFINIMNETK